MVPVVHVAVVVPHVVLGMLRIAHRDQAAAVVAVNDEQGAVPEVRRLARQNVPQDIVGERRLAAGRVGHPHAAVAHVVLAHRHVAVSVHHLHKAAYAVVGELSQDGVLGTRALEADALDRAPAPVNVRLAHVAQRVGDRRHLDMAGHAVVRLCDAAVGTGHLDGAVKHVVRGDGRGNSVDGAAEGGHSVTVNRRVVNLHHAAERVINHPPARHNNLVRSSSTSTNERHQQQQQQYMADMSNRIHNNDRFIEFISDYGYKTPYEFLSLDRIHQQK